MTKGLLAHCQRSASLSDDGRYRWSLERIWEPKLPKFIVIGLNPSTADATVDDPTIRKCVSFAARENAGGLVMLNLFAYRTKSPQVLKQAAKTEDIVGLLNDQMLIALTGATQPYRRIICAWGNDGDPRVARSGPAGGLSRAAFVVDMLRSFGRFLECFGVTTKAAPCHPLYLRGDTKIVPLP